ncbi:MAG TPA: AAA family ATPase, partial [Thermomicrobiales bacterium]|nr:AAA family ATPase [Thermomicrobiales bacterium]
MNLLERESHLQELRESLDRCVEGQGQLVFLGGEAGIGKTSVAEQFLTEARTRARSVVISCDGLKMPGPFGAMYDIAEALGPDVEHLLATQAPRDQIFRGVLAALREASQPLVLVGEDAHWSDEATLELIRFLGRRIGTTRTLFIVIYRDDQLGPHHPLRRTLGDLVTAPAVRRIELPRLSREAVELLAEGTGIDPIELHRRTGGNPFYVTEIIGAGSIDVPPTVRDAVLARASNLSPEARAVLDAVAAIGVIVDPELLAEVVGGPIEDAVEECLAVGMLRPSDRVIAFRHGLGQDTILRAMSMPRRRALHRCILAAMESRPALAKDLAHLAYHAEEAGDT